MRRFAAPLAVLALTAALAACTDEPEPRFTDPTPEPSETATEPTTEPTSEPTTEPTQEPEALGPEETVRAWVAARNQLLGSGESDEVRALGTSPCESCDGLIKTIERIYRDGGYIRSEGWTVVRAKRVPDFATSRIVTAAIDVGSGETVERRGAKPVTFANERIVLDFKVARRDGEWRIQDVVFLS